MVFHYLSKRRAAVGLESPLLGLMWLLLAPSWGWNLLYRPAVGLESPLLGLALGLE